MKKGIHQGLGCAAFAFVAAVMGAALTSRPALALDCDNPQTSADVSACLEQELRDSDQTINATYQELRGKLDDATKLKLRDDQRAWLKQRDRACALDSKESDRERWMRTILADPKKTVCVVRFTRARVAQLEDMLASASVDEEGEGEDDLADNARYEIISPNTHSTGKWYFEVRMDRGAIAKQAETALWIGVASESGGGLGNLINIRKTSARASPLVYGVAVDLAQGKVYSRQNGTWADAPGSSGGLDIKLGRPYSAEVTSSAEMGAMLDGELIVANFGDAPFAYSLPDGYRPFSQK